MPGTIVAPCTDTMSAHHARSARTLVVLLSGVMLAAQGCATSVPERYRGAQVGDAGDGAALVLAGPGVVDRLSDAQPGWELTRRDGLLSARSIGPLTALDQWPVQTRPTLSRTRHLELRDRARSIIYFDRVGPNAGTYYGRRFP
jgi:hypothetical protein